jgi:hypothetical protein
VSTNSALSDNTPPEQPAWGQAAPPVLHELARPDDAARPEPVVDLASQQYGGITDGREAQTQRGEGRSTLAPHRAIEVVDARRLGTVTHQLRPSLIIWNQTRNARDGIPQTEMPQTRHGSRNARNARVVPPDA